MYPNSPDNGPTSAQLRDRIDRGGAGDKVAVSDPAAAPLGTDDEAAGHPPTVDLIRRAMAHESTRDGSQHPYPPQRPQDRQRPSNPLAWLWWAVPLMLVGGTTLGFALQP